METLATIALVVTGLIHLLPLSGVLGEAKLRQLYELDLGDENTLLLMRHRAVLFGLLGCYFLYAAVDSQEQLRALCVAWITVLSFLVLGKGRPLNTSVKRVFRIDLYLIPVLLVGTVSVLF